MVRPGEPEQKPLTLVDIEQEIATGIAEPTPAVPDRTEVKTEPTLRAEPTAVRVASASAAAVGRTERPVASVWEDDKPAEAAVAPELETLGNSIIVEGYTDKRPLRGRRDYDNWDLSVDRAVSVVKLLRDTFGLDPARLAATGGNLRRAREGLSR